MADAGYGTEYAQQNWMDNGEQKGKVCSVLTEPSKTTFKPPQLLNSCE